MTGNDAHLYLFWRHLGPAAKAQETLVTRLNTAWALYSTMAAASRAMVKTVIKPGEAQGTNTREETRANWETQYRGGLPEVY